MKSDEGLRIVLLRTMLALLESEGDVRSLRAVVRGANMSAMAPYRHFEDRAALLAAVADGGFALLGDALTAADAHDDQREALYGQGVAFTRLHGPRLVTRSARAASPFPPSRSTE